MENINEKVFTAKDAANYTDEHIIIPHGYTAIGDEAFRNRDDIISVEISDSVTIIGSRAFELILRSPKEIF